MILLSGIPSTGKGCFASYLAREHSFAHYDLEHYPQGWPHPELKRTWDADCTAFVAEVQERHDRVALDWGFPVQCLPTVEKLQANGVRLIWFGGDITRAREKFVQRAERRGEMACVTDFDNQVEAIQKAGYPGSLDSVVTVDALPASGVFLDPGQIVGRVFGP